MTARPCALLATLALAFVFVLTAGCAAPQRPPVGFADARLTAESAAAAVAPGRSTKSEVIAALGPGTAIPFDSGWEVRVWRLQEGRGAREPTEFVALFAPDGLLRKTRIRRPA